MRQLHTELTQSAARIRNTNEALKVLRTRHTELKARLTEARVAKKAQDKSS